MKSILKIALTISLVMAIGMAVVPYSHAHNAPLSKNTVRVDDNSRILVWNANNAATPAQVTRDNPGQLAFINGSGTLTPISDVLAGSSRVELCGPNAVSPNGRFVAIYEGIVGGVSSSLYVMVDGEAPVLVNDQFQPIGCVGGNGILDFAPDSSYMTFIEYERDFNVGFADGMLRIVSTEDFSELFSERLVVAFEQAADGVAFVRFFQDDRSEADEVAILFWDGNTDRELTSFFAEEGCRYLNANIKTAPDGQLWLGLVSRCTGNSTQNVYRINPQTRSVELIFSVKSGGAFPQSSEANRFWFSADGNTLFYTIPDGFTLETVSLNAYDITTGESRTLIERQVVIPGVNGSDTGNQPTRISPDGRWLIAVVTDPDGSQTRMNFYDLQNPTAEPVVIAAGGRDDIITYMDFTPDGNKLVYVSGGLDNSLYTIDLTADTLNPLRVRRGNFSGFAAISPDSKEIAIAEFQILEDGVRGPDYLNLVVIDLETSAETNLFTGGEVIDDQAQNLKFAVPVYWLQ
ncbi:MAG: hypothetical protein CUN55_13825 [Phototrophicales bacterium]|nr:MAG: hypothetical protein CUN55_13825 [Phototrophicales bacterium]